MVTANERKLMRERKREGERETERETEREEREENNVMNYFVPVHNKHRKLSFFK